MLLDSRSNQRTSVLTSNRLTRRFVRNKNPPFHQSPGGSGQGRTQRNPCPLTLDHLSSDLQYARGMG